MKSSARGMSISEAEVTHIDTHGIWVLVKGHEYFLPRRVPAARAPEMPVGRDAGIL